MPQSSITWVFSRNDSHLAAIQLCRGKVLLEKPVLKKRQTKKHPSTVVANQHSGESTETSNSVSSNSINDFAPVPASPHASGDEMSVLSLSQFLPTIIEGYKTDV
jgi:hypothetical protein